MATEQWRPVPGFEGEYEVSSEGRVRSLARTVVRRNGSPMTIPAKEKSQRILENGYMQVYLWSAGKARGFFVHRLVLLAFVGVPDDPKMEAHHGPDPNRQNNRLANLRWVTKSENIREAMERKRTRLDILAELAHVGRQSVRNDNEGEVPF